MTRRLWLFVFFALSASGVRGQDLGPIVHEGLVNAPVEQVWAAFTTAEGLRSWLAPNVAIDLRIGGVMRTNYNAAATLDDPSTIENTIISFEPRRMLSIKVTRAPADFPFPDAIGQMWTIVYFDAAGTNQSLVREVGLGFTADPESQRMRAFFDRGNAQTLRQLQEHFAHAR